MSWKLSIKGRDVIDLKMFALLYFKPRELAIVMDIFNLTGGDIFRGGVLAVWCACNTL